ncbi:succinate--CoA ligase [GDP-forming] subunit beta, mitochondrial [Zootermopsis nevadensis]|nr:succinate--CoA ligase [GDP-forming] subunit beta, mitochondrial [Zootermopsis nevadensis]XP_021922527.1 succinate--CoA ligase [GDP-forming] subunit beta, mitochondrial [Zootermopsis nevadensis]
MAAVFKTLMKTKLSFHNVAATHVRYLNLLEYQSKALLQSSGVAIQKFRVVENLEEVRCLTENFKVDEYVIKAQVHAGGRGLGYFDNGFQSGVHITKDSSKVADIVGKMLGHRLITKQTPKEGILVKKVMIAESVNIMRETYICILMDRGFNGPVIIASSVGGTDIENVAERTPHLIKTVPVDVSDGVTDSVAESVADFLKFEGSLKIKASEEIKKMWNLFQSVDALQMEINPFVETDKGDVISVDAKLQFDDNARFRQSGIFSLEDVSGTDPREVEAARAQLNYIPMRGNIGCLVNGAGLAMATMDIIKLHGGEPANFLDVGGGVQEGQVSKAFQILMSDSNVKAILVNVFGGIVNCATIANGIINASLNLKLNIPLIVRLEGTNVNEAKKILSTSGLDIVSASDLEEAAQKAVSCIK